MKIKVWAVVDTRYWRDEGEIEIMKVTLYLTEEEARKEGVWYVIETELELDLGRTVVVND